MGGALRGQGEDERGRRSPIENGPTQKRKTIVCNRLNFGGTGIHPSGKEGTSGNSEGGGKNNKSDPRRRGRPIIQMTSMKKKKLGGRGMEKKKRSWHGSNRREIKKVKR